MRASLQWSDSRVELIEFQMISAIDVVAQSPENQLIFFVPPSPVNCEIRCSEMGLTTFRPASPLRFRPAGIAYELQGLHGHCRVLRYSFSDERLKTAIGEKPRWQQSDIERALDLSDSRLQPMLMKMLDEVTSPNIGSETVIEAMSVMTIVELVRHLRGHRRSAAEPGRLSGRIIDRIRERVEQEDYGTPSVRELAILCGMSERNLLRLFRATTGETVAGYIRRIRLARAKNYLISTNMPLKEIAFRVGFAQPSAFIAAFRKATAETPDQFRRRLRTEQCGGNA